ncbi:MAG TPA: hypothetical protein VGK57_06700, partial [Candidatus Binatia bacterium]
LDAAQRHPYFYVPYDLSMMQPNRDLSIIIAAYNEAERIPKQQKDFTTNSCTDESLGCCRCLSQFFAHSPK